MKRLFIFSTFLLCLLSTTFSQQSDNTIKPNLKYGKPSKEEFTMTSFAPDTTATAIYLFRKGESSFAYKDGFQLVTEHWVRIKVLKPQGVSYADITVPYYSPSDKDKGQERASEINGCSYNMENGQCVETPLKRDLISDERVNQHIRLLKFSIPAVKEGTVIEYHYKLYSDYFAHIDNWMMQDELPMIYNQYKITIPHAFIYNIELRGKDWITSKEKETSIHGVTTQQSGVAKIAEDFSIPSRELTFTSQHLPAIRQDEAYCWCPEDYKIQISFDLQGTQFPGREYEPFSQKWEDVDKQLNKPEDELFGQHLSFNNPFKEEAKAAFTSEMTFEQKVVAAFRVLKQKLSWTGRYELYSKDPAKVIKAGSGSNAELNFILMAILKDYGIRSYPVVLSRRSTGMLPFNFPSLQKLNTFLVAAYNMDTQSYVYLDSSMELPALNILPLDLCVNRARLLSPNEPEEKKWVDLINLGSNVTFMNVNATVQDGQIRGHRTTQLQGQQAVEYRKQLLKQKKDSLLFTSPDAGKEKFAFKGLKVESDPYDFTQIKEEFDFMMNAENTGGRLYINPMVFQQLERNPFIQTERILPIEFPYPYKYHLMCSLTLPDGYEVEEIPQSYSVKTEDDKLHCKYMIQQNGNKVTLSYVFQLRTHILSPDQYTQLQEIWTKVIEKNQALIVLKKR